MTHCNVHRWGEGGLTTKTAQPTTKGMVVFQGATAGLKIIGHCFSFKPGHRNCFAYLTDNHTSVIGMRELFREKEPQITVRPLDSHDLIKGPVAQETFEKALLAFPAMSNFCGFKYPIESVLKLWGDTWTTILDASALVSTCELNLSQLKPDFVVLSFYKIFGYPTGLGALLVKSDVMDALHKTYFGGGTVEMHFTRSSIHVPRRSWVDYFEDGTLPYHQIMALRHGFSALKRHVPGGIKAVESHTFGLAQYLYQGLARILHENGNPVVEIYHSSNFISVKEQGGIVNFNLLQCDGKYFGFNVFHRLAKLEQVLVRVGCFCNVGACQKYLQFSDQTMMANYQKGHVCGDDIDLVNGHPTGSIRISFGYYSTTNDVDIVIDLVRNHFVQEDTLKTHYLSTQKAVIEAIYIYPIKSCAPIKVNSWRLSPSGLEYDRHWSIMQNGKCLNQKKIKKLCLLQPDLNLVEGTLILNFPGMTPHILPIQAKNDRSEQYEVCLGSVCGETMDGLDCGQDASEWLCKAFGESNLKLVQQLGRSSVSFNSMSLANEAPYLVVNKSSVDLLWKKLVEDDHLKTHDMTLEILQEQFRANLIISGDTAFQEDQWESIIGRGFSLAFHKKCLRCSMISIDQRSGLELTGVIKTLTRMTKRGFCFGTLFKNSPETSNAIIIVGTNVQIQMKQNN
ncbi:molybdenum cofactor sulfurase 3-like [Tigriopus californicus]|uniref:molybdenum cofactor sulfurase 3-like n=1 Tax=Tigriopus californicus TaxID=6832 RepID=UPI0027DAA38F|nr:molybdenum cofactor sulfurase 3-like [Tigriopus californicus]